MLLSHTLLVPHLPTLMLDEYRGHTGGMVSALRDASLRMLSEEPSAVVVLSARWVSPRGAFLVDAGRRHRTITDYAGFGVEVRYDCPGHPRLAKALIAAGAKARVRTSAATRGVDSGVAVPLYFLAPDRDLPVVPLSLVNRPGDECRRWGAAIRGALAAWPERVAFVVSGMLSFNEHAWTMKREVAESVEFDERALDALRDGAWDHVGDADEPTLERVLPKGRLRHLDVLRGFLGEDAQGEVLCYEASPGAGAALVSFDIADEDRGAAPSRAPAREGEAP
jgi:aromatic ring-opening dioxygenase catalytic subunit (LigB family)